MTASGRAKGAALSAVKFIGRATWAVLALIGLVVVAVGILSSRLGLYQNDVSMRKLSPDGKYIAQIVTSDQAFDIERMVTIKASAGGKGRAVLVYESPYAFDIGIAWRDRDTLAVSLPCIPPDIIRPVYHGDENGQLRRIIVEAQPADPACRFARGVAPAGGFPGDQP